MKGIGRIRMETPFAVTKHVDGAGVSRLLVAGELDQDTGDTLTSLIVNAAEQHGVSTVVVDLRQATFLAAAGVRALLRGHDAAVRMGRAFRVVNATGIVHRVLELTGVQETLADSAESDVPAS